MNNSYTLEKANPADEKRFAYRPNFVKYGLSVIACGGLSAASIFSDIGTRTKESHNSYAKLMSYLGLDLSQVMRILGFALLVMSLYGLAVLIYSFVSNNRYVVLTKSSLLTPASNFNSKCHEVRFVDISNVSIIDIASNKLIRIKHKAGKIDLASIMFKNKDMFNECYAAILAVKQSA